MKTDNPHIRCHSCPEGSQSLVRNKFAPLYAAGALVFVLLFWVLLKLYYGQKAKFRTRKLTLRQGSSPRLRLPIDCNDVKPREENSVDQRSRYPVDMSYQNLKMSVSIPTGISKVLNDVSGRIRDRSLVAVMGESGSGKSSFLNAISGRAQYAAVSGKIALNGQVVCSEKCRRIVGLVPQDDVIHSALTVMENLVFAGRFSLSSGTPTEEIIDLAHKVLLNLGLLGVKDRIVGTSDSTPRISGGERRRCSIGVELMARPKLLLVDEPTSGLDSASSMLVMNTLKLLVNSRGITVVSTIHQPRQKIFELFDDVILLAKGRQLFHGSAKKAIPFFVAQGFPSCNSENPGDWLLDISTGCLQKQARKPDLSGKEANDIGLIPSPTPKSCIFSAIPLPPPMPTLVDQIWTQVSRNLLLSYRCRHEKAVDACMIVGGAALISMLEGVVELTTEPGFEIPFRSFEGDAALPFYSMWSYTMRAANRQQHYGLKIAICCGVLVGLAATKTHSERRAIFFREAASGYNVSSYFIGLQIVSLMEHGVFMFLAAVFSFWMRHPISSIWAYIINFFVLGFSMGSWGTLFSVLVEPENLILTSGLFLLSFNLLAAGVIEPILYKDIYDQPATAGLLSGIFSPARFFIETMVTSDHKNLGPQSGFTVQDSSLPLSSFDFISEAQLDPDRTVQSKMGWYWGSVRLFFVGLSVRCLSLALINVTARDKQCKKPFWKSIAGAKAIGRVIVFVVALLLLWAYTAWLVVN